MPLTSRHVVELLARQKENPLTLRQLAAALSLPPHERHRLERLLRRLQQQGRILLHKGGRYGLPSLPLMRGTLALHRDGYGFLRSDRDDEEDLFIPARELRGVMDGDRLEVRVERSFRGRSAGRLEKVLERGQTTLLGRYERHGEIGLVVPVDGRTGGSLLIPAGQERGAQAGAMVVARILRYPSGAHAAEGEVERIFGLAGDPGTEVLVAAHRFGLVADFPQEVVAASESLPQQVLPQDYSGREDLRSLPLVTIDGESARDFDDAVAVRRDKEGVRLWVAIADVGHYVKEKSLIDQQAFQRGTSVYFPDRALPMLPETLSHGICSLNPKVERLVLVAEMLFSPQGERLEARFYPAVMRSWARLTYHEVFDALQQARTLVDLPEIDLALMVELAESLMVMRRSRGSLDFDLPESEILLDGDGHPECVKRGERTIAHRLIEEFMLAANEAVADFLTRQGTPLLYRIHEPPDMEKLWSLQECVAHFNHGLVLDPAGPDPRRLQALLNEVAGLPEERLVNQMLLRAMRQARYAAENLKHFGLAAECYCHFTSPIRRYPDLVVHRLLRQTLEQGRLPSPLKTRWERRLPQLGESSSSAERRAMEAERDLQNLYKCRYMAARCEEEFSGVVAHVHPFGFFVELHEVFVEGLVHVTTLDDDYYRFDEILQRLIGEQRRRSFAVGDTVQVRVSNVDLDRRQIDFRLNEVQENCVKPGRPTHRPRRGRLGARRRGR
ncbi:MAG: ribonuclease R [Desulfuromonas sp.]|nr:MAG: ribonuclease R [Desulfuromonas sp.]